MTLVVTMKDGRRITACTTVQYVVVTTIETGLRGIAVEIQHKNGKIELIDPRDMVSIRPSGLRNPR